MVEIFDNRVEISNPGGLPKGLTPEKFGTRSISRNPVISSLFHRAGYIEKMGTGINRIKKALKEAGNPGPIFEFDSFFTTIFQRDMEAGNESSGENTQETTLSGEKLGDRLGDRLGDKLGDRLGDKLGENRIKILTAMKNHPTISITDLSKQIGISTTAIEKNIDFLKNEGFLERIGPGKGGHWHVIEKKKE